MDFTTKDPVEISNYIRWWLGDLPEATISSDTIQFIISMIESTNPTYTGCDLTYYATVDVLKWLVRKQNQGGAGGSVAGSGEISKRTERVGEVTVTTEWDVGTTTSGGSEAGWEKILQDLLDSPNSIGCAITQSETQTASTGSLVIGGSSLAEAERVRTNTDSRSGFCISNPFRNKSGW